MRAKIFGCLGGGLMFVAGTWCATYGVTQSVTLANQAVLYLGGFSAAIGGLIVAVKFAAA